MITIIDGETSGIIFSLATCSIVDKALPTRHIVRIGCCGDWHVRPILAPFIDMLIILLLKLVTVRSLSPTCSPSVPHDSLIIAFRIRNRIFILFAPVVIFGTAIVTVCGKHAI